ncbi:jg5945 [Pararge aegeria aegeria]|uniref:Jg5945 protein n=1 Tax=Pararge aegeria aegeria TaxID=348720 RepID=A0A8S4RGI6_9NEOP|nr:jg5945 [Pararge aegeria aegeria]
MWAFRPLCWTRKVSNEEVLRRVNQRRELLHTIKIRKVAYLGHVLSHERYELLATYDGKSCRKRRWSQKKSWVRNIREWTEIASAALLFRLAKEFTKLLPT